MQQSPARSAHKGAHACESFELDQYGILVGCAWSMSIQQSLDRAAQKRGHACESIELHQSGALVGGLGLARRSLELRGGSAAQGRGRRAASAEAFDVHGVCLYNNR